MRRTRGQKVKDQGHMVTKTVTFARLLVNMASTVLSLIYTPLCYLRPLPLWVCMSIRFLMFSSYVRYYC